MQSTEGDYLMKKMPLITLCVLIAVLAAACTPAAAPVAEPQPATVDLGPVYTAAVQTYEAEATRNAGLLPTATDEPLPTAADVPPTATLEPIAVVPTGPTATLWIPASGSTYPTITALLDTNCRKGPGKVYEIVGGLHVGETSKVHGKLRDGGWWYIENITNPEPKYCWVWAETTVVTGDTDALPDVVPPVPPAQAHPILNLSISVDPATWSGSCPKSLVITGTIESNIATTVTYQFINENGGVMHSGMVVFSDDGTQTVSTSIQYSDTASGWYQMKITSPVIQKSGTASYSIDCP
jgi:hypothetical protein